MRLLGLVTLESSGADSSGLTEASWRFQAALMFGSRNGMSLGGHCVRRTQFVSGRRCGDARSCPLHVPSTTEPYLPRRFIGIRNSIPIDMLSRIPTASLGKSDGEGPAPLEL